MRLLHLQLMRKEHDMDRYLTKAEVSERLRRPIATLNYWRHMGTGPKSALIGGRVLYRESDVARWVEDQTAADHSYGTAS
jgi:predicted DNA-binding transcriptional regulator AlpA